MNALLKLQLAVISIFLINVTVNGQVKKSKEQEIGFAYGPSFSGPIGQMSDYLESQGYDSTSSGFIFGPIDYPVTAGPRDSFSLFYSRALENGNQLEIEFNRSTLGEIAGLNNSGERIEVGFQSYGIGSSYRFGSRLTKLSVGPTIMYNRMYSSDLENLGSAKDYFDSSITFGLKGKLLLYIWNKEKWFFNLGFSYLISYSTEFGPFPTSGNNQLEPTKLNFGHGNSFLSFGLKL